MHTYVLYIQLAKECITVQKPIDNILIYVSHSAWAGYHLIDN